MHATISSPLNLVQILVPYLFIYSQTITALGAYDIIKIVSFCFEARILMRLICLEIIF